MTKTSKQSFLEVIFLAFFIWHIFYFVVSFAFFFILGFFKTFEPLINEYSFEINSFFWLLTFVLLLRSDGYFRKLFAYKQLKYRVYTVLGFIFFVAFFVFSSNS